MIVLYKENGGEILTSQKSCHHTVSLLQTSPGAKLHSDIHRHTSRHQFLSRDSWLCQSTAMLEVTAHKCVCVRLCVSVSERQMLGVP